MVKNTFHIKKDDPLPETDYIFYRISLNIYNDQEIDHYLQIPTNVFINKIGNGLSVDWEELCHNPRNTQIRGGRNPSEFGVVVLCIGDIRKHEELFPIYDPHDDNVAHSLIKGFLKSLTKQDINLDINQKLEYKSKLLDQRHHLSFFAYWVIPLEKSKIKLPSDIELKLPNMEEMIGIFFDQRPKLLEKLLFSYNHSF